VGQGARHAELAERQTHPHTRARARQQPRRHACGRPAARRRQPQGRARTLFCGMTVPRADRPATTAMMPIARGSEDSSLTSRRHASLGQALACGCSGCCCCGCCGCCGGGGCSCACGCCCCGCCGCGCGCGRCCVAPVVGGPAGGGKLWTSGARVTVSCCVRLCFLPPGGVRHDGMRVFEGQRQVAGRGLGGGASVLPGWRARARRSLCVCAHRGQCVPSTCSVCVCGWKKTNGSALSCSPAAAVTNRLLLLVLPKRSLLLRDCAPATCAAAASSRAGAPANTPR
jgi:hypothetical protein